MGAVTLNFREGLNAFPIIVKSKAMVSGVYTICSVAGLLLIYLTSQVELTHFLWVGSAVSLACFLIGNSMYNLNDFFDKNYDETNDRDKPLLRENIKPRYIVHTTIALTVVSLILLAIVNIRTLVLGVICVSLGTVYSSPPLRLKKRAWGKPLTITSVIMFSTMIGSLALGKNIHLMTFMTASIGAFVLTILHTHDLRDIEGDKEEGCKTLPIIAGKRVTIALAAIGYGLMGILALIGSLYFGLNYIFPAIAISVALLNLKKLTGIWPPNGSNSAYEKVRIRNRMAIISFVLMFPIGAL